MIRRSFREASVVFVAVATACANVEAPLDSRVRADATSEAALDAPTSSDAPTVDVPIDSGVDSGVDSGAGCARGTTMCGAACVTLDTDPANCGVCGNACGAGEECRMGACECAMGQRRCEDRCVDTQSSASHCGACGVACPTGQMCVRGACRVDCPLPGLICGAGASMQCVDATSNVSHCGRCDNACPTPANASAACALGTCELGPCTTGFGNCDSNAANGCEVDTRGDVRHCGRCGNPCAALANATPSCAAGMCGLGACVAGFGDCDGNASNGCEVNTNTSVAHCGGCGRVCGPIPNGAVACAVGACAVAACNAGFANCDGNAANGCEVNTNTTATHCGACGRVCAAGSNCVSGACVAPTTTVTFPSSMSRVGVTPIGAEN